LKEGEGETSGAAKADPQPSELGSPVILDEKEVHNIPYLSSAVKPLRILNTPFTQITPRNP